MTPGSSMPIAAKLLLALNFEIRSGAAAPRVRLPLPPKQLQPQRQLQPSADEAAAEQADFADRQSWQPDDIEAELDADTDVRYARAWRRGCGCGCGGVGVGVGVSVCE